MERGPARQHGNVAGLLERKHTEPNQVCNAEPVLQAQGRKRHDEIREGSRAQRQDWQDPTGLRERLQVKGDARETEGRRPLLH